MLKNTLTTLPAFDMLCVLPCMVIHAREHVGLFAWRTERDGGERGKRGNELDKVTEPVLS